jgi:hypothetical protein
MSTVDKSADYAAKWEEILCKACKLLHFIIALLISHISHTGEEHSVPESDLNDGQGTRYEVSFYGLTKKGTQSKTASGASSFFLNENIPEELFKYALFVHLSNKYDQSVKFSCDVLNCQYKLGNSCHVFLDEPLGYGYKNMVQFGKEKIRLVIKQMVLCSSTLIDSILMLSLARSKASC